MNETFIALSFVLTGTMEPIFNCGGGGGACGGGGLGASSFSISS